MGIMSHGGMEELDTLEFKPDGISKLTQMKDLCVDAITYDIERILDVQLKALRCMIEEHNLGCAKLECTLIDINMRQQLEKLKELA